MGGTGDSGQGSIGAAAKAAFLAALHAGARREDAAEAAGFSLTGFYGARRRDPDFAAAWTGALAAGAAAGRRRSAYDRRGTPRTAPANRRPLQRRRGHLRFDAERQSLFLAHFACNADTRAAAAEAGVSESTVHNHRRTDEAFAAAYAEALDCAYVRLEAELVRQRIAAQARLRAALDEAEPPGAAALAETAQEFERVLKLLARRDRKPRAPDRSGARRRVWTFEAAIELLGERLDALAIPVAPLDAEAAARSGGAEDPAP